MADNGRWFKVWTSILDDPDFQELTLEQIGRWVLLGAMTKFVGDRGELVVNGSARRLAEVLRCEASEIETVVNALPNVHFGPSKRVNGKRAVTWANWRKYQEDSTTAERVKALRAKRRGEESTTGKRKTPVVNPRGSDIPDPPDPSGDSELASLWEGRREGRRDPDPDGLERSGRTSEGRTDRHGRTAYPVRELVAGIATARSAR